MRFRVHRRAIACSPDIIFEELEQRIVLDASVDPIGVDSHLGGPDLLHGLLPGLNSGAPSDQATAHHTAAGDWTLEYSSDPASKMAHVLDHDDLALVDVELGTPAPEFELYAVPTVTDTTRDVDLGGAVRITAGDTTQDMYMVITANPRGLTNAGIYALFLTQTTALDVTMSSNATDTTVPTIWTLQGPMDSLNAILATMTARVSSCFNGSAEIEVTLTDGTHTDDTANAPLQVGTLYVPVDRTPHEPAATVPNPQTIPSSTWFSLPVSVLDEDSNELSVIVSVNHGVINIPSVGSDVEGLVAPPVTYFGTHGPDGRPLEQGPRVGVRGPVPNLQHALANLQYRSFPGYFGDDQMTVTVADEAFLPRAGVCYGDRVSITSLTVV